MLQYLSDICAVCDADLSPQRWPDVDLSLLRTCTPDIARGKEKRRLNNVTIMIDTETSKTHVDVFTEDKNGKRDYAENVNIVTDWSLAVSLYGMPCIVIVGHKPSDLCKCMERIHETLKGNYTVFYCHNLAYDYVFLRKFLYAELGVPESQLATKPHYPISIKFENGIELRDSLILAQCSLEKWANDLDVVHRKAVGQWDYEKIRTQHGERTKNEITYVINDVLAGVECIDALRASLHKSRRAMPLTATGIVRNELRTIAKQHNAHEKARACYTFETYNILRRYYHGGYTHCNRWRKGDNVPAICFDFASSYPFCMLAFDFPCERFVRLTGQVTQDDILQDTNNAYLVYVQLANCMMRDPYHGMPYLQISKFELAYGVEADNGRAISCDYVELWTNEVELALITELYTYDDIAIGAVYRAAKKPLPRYMTDYVYNLYKQKCELKGGDPVLYALSKSKINSIYGMTVQQLVKDDIIEDYDTGDYITVTKDTDADFEKAVNNHNMFLFYAIGCWVTSYAVNNLYKLGSCAKTVDDWLYSDTDSCYFSAVSPEKIAVYNDAVTKLLERRGYPPVTVNGKTYRLGVAELDGAYHEFVALHSKCYVARRTDGPLKITVAGVPKKNGVKCLNDDIRNFRDGFVFSGEITGKKTHVYNFVDSVENWNGNEVGDSINLIPCDYEVSDSLEKRIEKVINREVDMPYYGDDALL